MRLIIVLTNKSKLAPVSRYNYEVMVGDGTPQGSTTIAHGSIAKHVRADGWCKLVQLLLNKEAHLASVGKHHDHYCFKCGWELTSTPNGATCERCDKL